MSERTNRAYRNPPYRRFLGPNFLGGTGIAAYRACLPIVAMPNDLGDEPERRQVEIPSCLEILTNTGWQPHPVAFEYHHIASELDGRLILFRADGSWQNVSFQTNQGLANQFIYSAQQEGIIPSPLPCLSAMDQNTDPIRPKKKEKPATTEGPEVL